MVSIEQFPFTWARGVAIVWIVTIFKIDKEKIEETNADITNLRHCYKLINYNDEK